MATMGFDKLDGQIWFDGQFIPWDDAKLHILSHGLHYASGVFEGERAYDGQIFELEAHTKRLMQSARLLDFEIPYREEIINSASYQLLELMKLKDAYIRPIAWRGSEMMGVSAQNNTIHLAIAAWSWPSYFSPEQRLQGLRLDFAKYRRPDPRTAPCDSKAAGLYMICTLSKHEAERNGFADALMLDWRGQVAEATGANIFFARDNELHTPTPDCFLDGITRQAVIKLAKARGVKIVERAIMPEELPSFSACFLTGTAAEVTPVAQIADTYYEIDDITRHLMQDYDDLVHRKVAQAANG